jgi:hypothetical protein
MEQLWKIITICNDTEVNLQQKLFVLMKKKKIFNTAGRFKNKQCL